MCVCLCVSSEVVLVFETLVCEKFSVVRECGTSGGENVRHLAPACLEYFGNFIWRVSVFRDINIELLELQSC